MKNFYFLLLFLIPSIALSQNFEIENYEVNIDIKEDGVCYITETIEVNFLKEMRGIFRDLELKGNFKTHIQHLSYDNIKVEGYNYKTEKNGNDLRIRIGDANTYITGKHTYVISYTASNGILNFENHEEIYWNIISPKWKEKIRESSFTVHLPPNAQLNHEDVNLYVGESNSTTDYGKLVVTENTVSGKSLISLGQDKGMSVGIRLPKGYFFADNVPISKKRTISQPSLLESFLKKDISYPLPIVLLLGMLGTFFTWGRNKDTYKHIEIFYPPEGMTPATVGTFYDHIVNNRDVISLLPLWGAEGLIRIRAKNPESRNPDIYLEKLKNIPSDKPASEKYFFENLFELGDVVDIEDLKYNFHNRYNTVKSLIRKEALDPPLFDKKAKRLFHSLPILMLGGTSIFFAIILFSVFAAVKSGIGFLIFGILCIALRFIDPKKSESGVLLKNQLESFKDTLLNTDDERLIPILEKDPQYFDKTFPYAVAYGIDKQYTKKFDKIFDKAPDWYYAHSGPIIFGDFGRSFRVENIGKTISVPPVADGGSSSFGGGGFSGGGFGGGGGGGW